MTDNQSVITVTLGTRFGGKTQQERISLPLAEIESRPALKAALLKAGIYALASSMKNEDNTKSGSAFTLWAATIDAAVLAAAIDPAASAGTKYLQADRVADARAIVSAIPLLASCGIFLRLPAVDFPAAVTNKNLPALFAVDQHDVLVNWDNVRNPKVDPATGNPIHVLPDGFPTLAFDRLYSMIKGANAPHDKIRADKEKAEAQAQAQG